MDWHDMMQIPCWNFSNPSTPTPKIMSLPAELRSLIFRFVVTIPSDTPVVTFRLDVYERDGYTEAVQPALTRVSRQVRREALPLFYECNDFVLHTEAPRLGQTRAWMRCCAPHLADLRDLSIWVRYAAPPRNRSAPSGAIRVRMHKAGQHGTWEAGKEWKWITVCRKPAGVEEDGMYLVETLRSLLQQVFGDGEEEVGVEDYTDVVMGLRKNYLTNKLMS